MALDRAQTDYERGLLRLRVGGKYVVERILGRGGMGCVALGRHEKLGQPVAIKFMLPSGAGDDTSRARFLREAQLAATLRSDKIVRVFDVGALDDGSPYMVMEYLEGRSLADELRSRTRVPMSEAAAYVLEALDAVAEAHGMGVVHRDLKPENLFLSKAHNGSISIKVLDFGISTAGVASEVNHSLTQTTSLLGSPQYMSPEQIRESKSVDARADVWSLGAVLYRLVEGMVPFEGTSIGEIFGKIQYVDPPPMRYASPEFEAVVRRCLKRDPNGRYRSARELGLALAPFVAAVSGEVPRAILPSSGAVAVARGYSEPPPTTASPVAPTQASEGVEHPKTLGALSKVVDPSVSTRGRNLLVAGMIGAMGVATVGGLGLAAFLHARQTASRSAPTETRDAPAVASQLPTPSATGPSLSPSAASTSASPIASSIASSSSSAPSVIAAPSPAIAPAGRRGTSRTPQASATPGAPAASAASSPPAPPTPSAVNSAIFGRF